ncbi:MAG TPA: CPBP family intramembrane metalloprotease [Firmicutes bacterium]|nr:CPBP family intramembrane metalloprotease [Bacillota bacterium]
MIEVKNLERSQRTKKIVSFVILTYAVSWGMAAVFFVFGGRWTSLSGTLVAVAYMFVPMTVAIIVQKGIYKEPVKGPLGISFKLNRWFLVAWVLPPIIAFGTFGVSLLLPGVSYSPGMEGMFERFRATLKPEQLEVMRQQIAASPVHPIWIALVQGLIAGITINAVAAFGEELGWRGFLQRELSLMGLGFWRSSALIGIIWGIWHAPLILQGHNYPQHPVAGVFMMTIGTLLMTPILSYVRLRAKSVIAAAVFHGSFNATYGLAIMNVKGGNDLLTGTLGLAGFISLAAVNLALLLYDRFFAKERVTALIPANESDEA